MDHRYLRYFIAVAEELNFTHAAERLHTVQPSLSQQIKRLEEIIGTPLFVRTKRRVELTEAGRIFLKEARSIVQNTESAINLARNAGRAEVGHLKVAFVAGAETRVLPRVLPELRKQYPEITVQLCSMSGLEQMDALLDHAIDVGFHGGPVDDPKIACEVVLRQKIVVALPANHPAAKLSLVSLSQLVNDTLIRPSYKEGLAAAELVNVLEEKAGFRFRSSMEVDNILTALNAVASGAGFAPLPDYISEILPHNVITKRLDINPQPVLNLCVTYRKDNRLPALAFFLSLLRQYVIEKDKKIHH